MASKFKCICKEYVNTNLFSGNNINLILSEDSFLRDSGMSAIEYEEHIDRMFDSSKKLVKCHNCNRLAIIDRDYNVQLYELIPV